MPGARCTPTSTAGHAASNCTLPPKIVHGVDHATTGMVRPVHVCCGVVFRQPQSTVLMAYQPGASGVPVFSPTVSPGCVTDPARAEAAVQSDRKPAVANFVSLLFICKPPSPPRRRSVADRSAELAWSMGMLCPMVTRVRQLRPRTFRRWTFLGTAHAPTHVTGPSCKL